MHVALILNIFYIKWYKALAIIDFKSLKWHYMVIQVNIYQIGVSRVDMHVLRKTKLYGLSSLEKSYKFFELFFSLSILCGSGVIHTKGVQARYETKKSWLDCILEI